MNIISQRARDKNVWAFAVTLIGVDDNFAKLTNKVRELQAIRINEETAAKSFRQEPALIALVRADTPSNRYKPYGMIRSSHERRPINMQMNRPRAINNSQQRYYRQP